MEHRELMVPIPVPVVQPQRPKRGRRRKRPELSEEERRALRALQNRQATRRSRERNREKAELMRSQLELSEIQREALKEERDKLLAKVNSGAEHESDSSQSRRNPMSLSVILNQDEGECDYVLTPPVKRARPMSCETSPVSISSPSSKRLAFLQKTVHDFT